MSSSKNHKEAPVKKPSISESVDSMIQKNKAEKDAAISASAEAKMAGIQEDVEAIVGMEKPSEKISEKKGESGEKGDLKGGGLASDDDEEEIQNIKYSIKDYSFPSEEVMVKKIRTAIKLQIKEEWKKVKSPSKLGRGGTANYNESIARIRKLKYMLSSVFTNTMHALKEMYVKYFTPDGKRKSLENLD